jgi:hypothetical protein
MVWSCPSCTLQNAADVNACVACGEHKPRTLKLDFGGGPGGAGGGNDGNDVNASNNNTNSPGGPGAAGIGNSMADDPASDWNCPQCTLLNLGLVSRCAVCDFQRPDAISANVGGSPLTLSSASPNSQNASPDDNASLNNDSPQSPPKLTLALSKSEAAAVPGSVGANADAASSSVANSSAGNPATTSSVTNASSSNPSSSSTAQNAQPKLQLNLNAGESESNNPNTTTDTKSGNNSPANNSPNRNAAPKSAASAISARDASSVIAAQYAAKSAAKAKAAATKNNSSPKNTSSPNAAPKPAAPKVEPTTVRLQLKSEKTGKSFVSTGFGPNSLMKDLLEFAVRKV